jgi:hypothetical protein
MAEPTGHGSVSLRLYLKLSQEFPSRFSRIGFGVVAGRSGVQFDFLTLCSFLLVGSVRLFFEFLRGLRTFLYGQEEAAKTLVGNRIRMGGRFCGHLDDSSLGKAET